MCAISSLAQAETPHMTSTTSNRGELPYETRRPALVITCACIVFIVYGSLFPFNFQATAQPFTAHSFELNPWRNRSDALDNVLLFAPLGTSIFFAFRSVAARIATAAGLWAALGIGMQLLQLYVPGRVGSMADAFNNAIGMLVGLLLGRATATWLCRKQAIGRFGDPLAMFLVVAWYAYESFPFLPTLDVGLLASHIKPVLAATEFEPVRFFRHATAAALGTLALLALQPLRSRPACLVVAAAVVFASEVLVPYGELRRETLLGIALGMALGERLDHVLDARARWAMLALALAAFVMSVVTDFRRPPEASRFTLTPFAHLLWQGATTDIPTSAFEALTIGALMWAGAGTSRLGSRPWHWPAIVIALVLLFEAVRVLLASGRADSSTLAIAVLLAPCAAAMHRRRTARLQLESSRRGRPPADGEGVGQSERTPATGPATTTPRKPVARIFLWSAAIAVAALTIGLRLLLEVPSLPYNVRKLLGAGSFFDLGFFAAVLLWIGAGPWCVARAAAGRVASSLLLPALLVAATLASLLLLWLAVPAESLDKITGSLDLFRRVTTENYWGPVWHDRMVGLSPEAVGALERAVRYVALYSLLLVPMTMAVVCLDKAWPLALVLPALGVLALSWWLAKWVVIEGAITDNLTELIAPGGLPWLAALALVFGVHVAWFGVRAPRRAGGALALVALTLGALPIGWWLLKQGLEQVIVKYGAVWSAQQFLLGQNRTADLSDGQLFARWSALYLGLVCVSALGMALARRLWPAEHGATGLAGVSFQHRHAV
jgi:VanZ family protein